MIIDKVVFYLPICHNSLKSVHPSRAEEPNADFTCPRIHFVTVFGFGQEEAIVYLIIGVCSAACSFSFESF